MPPNGTLEARVDGGSIPSGTIVQRGKIVTFTATPHTNHEVEKWEVNGSVITNTTNTYVCTVTNAVYVKVSFGPLPAGYATYNVEHYQQKADDTYPAAPAEIEILNGEVGTIAAYTPKTDGAYENFTYKPALTQISGTIESDGSTVIKLFYERKTCTVTFAVSGTGGTLKAEVDGTEVHSPYQAEKNKTIVFTATPTNEYYAVEKWTDGGTDIAGETATVYTHTVTADATIAVHFKTAPVDVYVTGTSGGKAYVWKNNTPTELRSHETGSGVTLCPYAVRSQGNDVYIAGVENVSGVTRPIVWKKDGSLHWIGTNSYTYAYDIAFYNGKTFVAGSTIDNASITDISDTANPEVTSLYTNVYPITLSNAKALCAESSKLYAAGFKRSGNTTVFLWTKPDSGSISETELGLEGNTAYTDRIPYGLCTAGSSVYVAAGNLWKVEGGTVTLIPVADARALYALCVHDGTVYAAGWTNAYKAAVWKIEGASASLYKELPTVSSGVFALCAAGGDLFAAGYYTDTDNKHKPVWWRFAADLTLTEHKLGTAKGEAFGICVTPQE